jgi:hypothetical protein
MNRLKYPRTPHLPWSPGIGDDDRILDDLSSLQGEPVIITVKMDGENTTLARDYIHARSTDSGHPKYRTKIIGNEENRNNWAKKG